MSITNSMNGRLQITLHYEDQVPERNELHALLPKFQEWKQNQEWEFALPKLQLPLHACSEQPFQYPLLLNPQKLPYQSLPSQNPHQEASIEVSVHEPSYWDSAGPTETPVDDDALHQQPYSVARPPLQPTSYSGDSIESSKSSQKLQNSARNKTPAQAGP